MPRRPKPPDPTYDALYRGVCAAPCDDVPRLVLADYLEERGDIDRASLIRLQTRLAAIDEWDDGYTEAELDVDRLFLGNLKNSKGWAPDFPEWEQLCWDGVASRGFIGGFPSSISVSTNRVEELPADKLAALPVAAVSISDLEPGHTDQVWEIAGRFPAARLEVSTRNVETIRALAARPLPQLDELGATLRTAAAVQDFAFPPVPKLWLSLSTAEAMRAVADRSPPAGLKELTLIGPVTDAAARRLAAAGWVTGLRRLRLAASSEEITPTPVPLLHAPGLGGLRSLDLTAHDRAETVNVVAAARRLGLLDSFGLRFWMRDRNHQLVPRQDELTPDQVSTLIRAPALAEVQAVRLPELADPDGSLAAVGAGAGLRLLELSTDSSPSGVTPAGIAALARSPVAATLRRLKVEPVNVTPALAAALTAGPGWPELAAVEFGYGAHDSDGGAVAEIIDSPKLPRLTRLSATGEAGAADLWRRLAASDAVRRFRYLWLHFRITDAEVNALLDSPAACAVGRLVLPVRKGTTARTRRRFERVYGMPLTQHW